jgi:hypothetical protein
MFMDKLFWRPVIIGDYWYIALLEKGASINHPLLPSTKKIRIGRVGGRVNYYDRAWSVADLRNKK